MQQFCRQHLSRSRRLSALLLAAAGASGVGTSLAEQPPAELQLQPPINSTLEIRVARRPWLLEKLAPKKKPEPSIKMTPPSPPALQVAPDPPSISFGPSAKPYDDGWFRRGSDPLAKPQGLPAKEQLDPNLSKSPATEPATANALRREQEEGELGALIRARPLHPDVAPLPLELEESRGDQITTPVNESTEPAQQSAADATATDVATEDTSHDVDTSAADQTTQSAPINARQTSQPDNIVVRDLLIDRDGSPRGETRPNAVSPSDQNDDATEPGKSQFVGTDPDLIAASVKLDYAGYPAKSFRVSNTVARMRPGMQRVLQHYHSRPEVANERSNWGMLHAIMVYGVDTRIVAGNRSYSAIAWIAGNNTCRGQKLLSEGPRGIVTNSGIGLQGHQAQMLAVFSLCDVPINYPIYANNNRYTIRDIVEAEMAACKSGEELTFTLIGLAHYLDTDAVWVGADGQRWDFERLIREELSQPIVGAACGGTHRLMGFAHALRKRRAEGRPITGQWKRAELFSQDFVRYTYQLQNRDGSMSTDWFEGREDNGNDDRKIQTTGHMVEWLLTLTPDSQLQDPRLVRAVRFLLNTMYKEPDYDWKIGPKGHALRSLAMYYERVYQRGPAWKSQSMASSSGTAHR